MPETGEITIEIARKLSKDKGKKPPHSSRLEFYVEILEGIILVLVAIATAYSGYQAAMWGGQQSVLFAQASSLDVNANRLIIENDSAGIYNTNTLNAWLNAKLEGREEIAEFYGRRFLPDYKVAFDAWIKLDPINNSQAPLGPMYMPEYHDSIGEEANNLSEQAIATFNEGKEAQTNAESYVRTTVYLATVLVLIAISQRFEIKSVRTGLIILSFGLLSFGILTLFMLPRM
jgi:hypothetical protein